MFYNTMLLSEDIETQRKGSISVSYAINQQQTVLRGGGGNGGGVIKKIMVAHKSFPVMVSVHQFCYNNYAWLPVVSLVQICSMLFQQLRYKMHFGEFRTVLAMKNESFGI